MKEFVFDKRGCDAEGALCYVRHLECSGTGKAYANDRFRLLSDDGHPLLFRYNLDRMRRELRREDFEQSAINGFWRYKPFLPICDPANIVSLNEIETPLFCLHSTANAVSASPGSVMLKDEGLLPTGAFKARGLSVAVSAAKAFGIRHLIIPTAGNAGSALAAYAARAGIRATIVSPFDAPLQTTLQTLRYTDDVHLVIGLINDCGKLIPQYTAAADWRSISTFNEPYRVEGKKTMGFEIAKQLDWRAPDAIFYPTGGGVGLIGIWKAFKELHEIGWLESGLPKMVAVQSEGCAPIVNAWREGKKIAAPVERNRTHIHGLRVPHPFADRLILETLRESNGFGVCVADQDAEWEQSKIARDEGVLLSLEGAAVVAAYKNALRDGLLGSEDRVVIINSASGLKNEFHDKISPVNKEFKLSFCDAES